jgi:hypothetical protein
MRRPHRLLAAAILSVALPAAAQQVKDTCYECHLALKGKLQRPAKLWPNDAHRRSGLACTTCHNGDATVADLTGSKGPNFVSSWERADVPKLCGGCHSDAALIEKHKPGQRVGQPAEYQAGVHGKALAAGDMDSANCIDCHGIHEIRPASDPLSRVNPLHVAETCGECHADAERMAKHKLPATPVAEYAESVHWEALSKNGSPHAPSCVNCHARHNTSHAKEMSSAAVCGHCHRAESDLLKRSSHGQTLSGKGGECVGCHGAHKVLRASAQLLAGPGPGCAQCHEAGSAEAKQAAGMARLIADLNGALERSDRILAQAAAGGADLPQAKAEQKAGREALTKARAAVHSFRQSEVAALVKSGSAIAAQTYRAGENALKKK